MYGVSTVHGLGLEIACRQWFMHGCGNAFFISDIQIFCSHLTTSIYVCDLSSLIVNTLFAACSKWWWRWPFRGSSDEKTGKEEDVSCMEQCQENLANVWDKESQRWIKIIHTSQSRIILETGRKFHGLGLTERSHLPQHSVWPLNFLCCRIEF